MKIYVGNLNYRSTQDDLREMFEEHGAVDDAIIILDRETRRSRGFGFVEMPNDGEAQSAIESLNGLEVGGRNLTVSEAKARESR